MEGNGQQDSTTKTPWPDWCEGFLQSLRECGHVGRSTAAAKIDRTTAYKCARKHSDFAEAWKEAKAVAGTMLLDEARRRAIEGLRRYKFNAKGEPIIVAKDAGAPEPYYEIEYSDSLLMFLIKGQYPEYRQQTVQHQGPGGGPLQAEVKVSLEVTLGQLLSEYDSLVARQADVVRNGKTHPAE